MIEKECPRCGIFLEEIKIRDYIGQEIFIDRCPSGCGLWFDKDEIFKSSQADINNIDFLNQNFIIQKNSEILCPKCKIKMGKYRNPLYKIDFELDFCNKCYGFWFDRGEAIKFKNIYQEKVKKLKEEIKITSKPSVENFSKIAMQEEQVDKFFNFILNILRFFVPFI